MDQNKVHTNKKTKPVYTSDINVIASIPDFNLINDVISAFAHHKGEEYINEEIFKQNVYGIRTLRSRKRFLSAITKTFIKFKNAEHQKVFYALFSQNIEKREKLKTTEDYLRYGIMQLDEINHHLGTVARNSSISQNFILLYFEQVEKIPQFYDQNEWVESESEIYHSLEKKIKNHYESRGLPENGFPKEQLILLKKEREKLLIAKRRGFANKQ